MYIVLGIFKDIYVKLLEGIYTKGNDTTGMAFFIK
jgi:hypothetical protein